MDQDALIDAETRAFIRKSESLCPADTSGRSVQQQRQVYSALCRAFQPEFLPGIVREDRDADGVPVRVYSAGHPTRSILFFHGGGFVLGGLDSHDGICAELCAQTGYRVIAVDYRLAPEHKHPAAFDDGWTALTWTARVFPEPIILVGDSAGGNLAAALAHRARDTRARIWGQVLIYPWLAGDIDTPSRRDHAAAPLLNRDALEAFQAARLSGPEPQDDPSFAPLQETDWNDLPPTVLFSADVDPLRDDARLYHDRLRRAAVPVHLVNEAGLVHGYLRARHCVGRSRDGFERIAVAIEALGQNVWPWG